MTIYSEGRPTTPTDATERIRVGIADYAVSTDGRVITTSGLGSCVGVAMFDEHAGVAGLVHVMLPVAKEPPGDSPGKFADTGTVALLDELVAEGARRRNVVAKIAGGSNMLSIGTSGGRVSTRNVESVESTLESADVPLVARHVGGTHGRSLEVRPDSGELFVKTVHSENVTL